jgi:steroid delta-isomerase-like uncharacterized protein
MENTKKAVSNLTELSRKGTAIEFFSAYQDLEVDRMIGLCEPNGEIHFLPLGEGGKGKINELGKNLWLSLMDCFPDLDNTVTSTRADEAGNVTCEVKIFGTQAKDFAGIVSKGKKFESDHIFIFHFNQDEKIDRISIDWDHQSFSRQLGA